MAGASSTGRSLEETPTWAVAAVCFVFVLISIIIEHILHLLGKWLKKRHKMALYEALEKIKSELMLLGFISLLLTVAQSRISNICIPASVAATWHPCSKLEEAHSSPESAEGENSRRRLLLALAEYSPGGGARRFLAGGESEDKCAAKGKVAFISNDGIHQLHIFIFALAVSHVLYCIITLVLSKAKMRRWKKWERETKTIEYQFSHDPERFRFARETSFGRRHMSSWAKHPVLIWIISFFRQFFRSVLKVDYLTLRHGFIMAHLAPQSHSKFDFQKYIKRSLEDDFKVVVGISPPIWFLAVLFLLFNTEGAHTYLWLPFIPLVVILLVGTKLQVIITKMGLRIQERGEVVKGVPVVEPGDDLFWFKRPDLILHLINFVLFQNAFQLAFFAWTWYEFGMKSCFHEKVEDLVIRITMGVVIQILCSYVTLPLYALVTQMGSTMKPAIFNDRVAAALRKWHRTARKRIKKNNTSGTVTPMSSRPGTPSHATSPVHLLRHYRGDLDSLQASPRRPSTNDRENFYWMDTTDGSSSTQHYHYYGGSGDRSETSGHNRPQAAEQGMEVREPSVSAHVLNIIPQPQEINVRLGSHDFSFDKRRAST